MKFTIINKKTKNIVQAEVFLGGDGSMWIMKADGIYKLDKKKYEIEIEL